MGIGLPCYIALWRGVWEQRPFMGIQCNLPSSKYFHENFIKELILDKVTKQWRRDSGILKIKKAHLE